MDWMNRLAETNEFVAPQLGSASARELAKRWKADGKLPSRLAIAWMSKGLVARNSEERKHFGRDRTDRVSTRYPRSTTRYLIHSLTGPKLSTECGISLLIL